MNQILFTGKDSSLENLNGRKNFLRKFKFQLYISLLVIVCSILCFLYLNYHKNEKERLSKSLINSFYIDRLYSNSQNYTTIMLNENTSLFAIGIIEIPKLDLLYPILYDTTDDFLKISPCRFYGPYPNEIGNLCIAGHNYDNNIFFSNLYKLSIGDYINIYDTKNKCVTYYVYDKFEISKSDTSCTSQETKGKREITLVTCNNINKNRLVIKAKE